MPEMQLPKEMLDSVLSDDESVDPLQVDERIRVVITGDGTEGELIVLHIRRMIHDTTKTGHVIHEKAYASPGDRFLHTLMFEKQGIFLGIVQQTQASDNGTAPGHPVHVEIQSIGTNHHKSLEKAFADPSVPADWTPYLVAPGEADLLPGPMNALIIKWRPTKGKTKQALKTIGDLLLRIGFAMVGVELHDLFGGANTGVAFNA